MADWAKSAAVCKALQSSPTGVAVLAQLKPGSAAPTAQGTDVNVLHHMAAQQQLDKKLKAEHMAKVHNIVGSAVGASLAAKPRQSAYDTFQAAINGAFKPPAVGQAAAAHLTASNFTQNMNKPFTPTTSTPRISIPFRK